MAPLDFLIALQKRAAVEILCEFSFSLSRCYRVGLDAPTSDEDLARTSTSRGRQKNKTISRGVRAERNYSITIDAKRTRMGNDGSLSVPLKFHKDFLRFIARELLDCGNPVAEFLQRS